MKNRHGDEYSFEHLGNNIYKFVMGGSSMRYCRMGGFEGQDVVDHTSLSYFDPAGGPFIGIGDKLSIGTVKQIKSSSEGFMIEVHAVPTGYTANELERDNPYNQWMYE